MLLENAFVARRLVLAVIFFLVENMLFMGTVFRPFLPSQMRLNG